MYENFEAILSDFDIKIKKSLYQTAPIHREDLEQEIKIKLYEKLSVIQNIEAPGYYEFVHGSSSVAEDKVLYSHYQKKE